MPSLELRLLPPVVVALWAVAMGALAKGLPALAVALPGSAQARLALAAFAALVGLALGIAGIVAFRRAQTTFNPVRPDKASCVVSSGVFQYSRNPMYLGMLCVLTGWALYLAHLLAFAALPLFVAYMTRFQIVPEEKHLAEKFGEPYHAYRNTVRRWL